MARDDGAAVNSRDRLVSGEDEPDEKQLESALRPANLDEFVGQGHLVGEGRLVRRLIEEGGALPSLILWGGPVRARRPSPGCWPSTTRIRACGSRACRPTISTLTVTTRPSTSPPLSRGR